ncbi:hypothetical protein TNCV_4013611 [Trichonephila clavipes]|nr:hypothetical protein TNCV_4013611 [Trichonephila clavipes]
MEKPKCMNVHEGKHSISIDCYHPLIRYEFETADSDEDISLNERDYEDSEESVELIENIPINSDKYITSDSTKLVPHNSNVPGRFATLNVLRRSIGQTSFAKHNVDSLVYADKPQTLDHLEDNIRSVIADIRPQTLEKVIENWTSRLDYIRASRGSPMPEIIFKM